MGRVQQDFRYSSFRQQFLHGEEGVSEAMEIMSGCRTQQREYREVIFGITCGKHVQIIAEVIAVSVRIPSNITIRLRVFPWAVTIMNPVLQAAAQALFSLLRCCIDRCAITGQGELLQVNQSLLCGREQKKFAEDIKEQ